MSEAPATPPANAISLSDIVMVVIRIFAINFGFYSFSQIFWVLPMFSHDRYGSRGTYLTGVLILVALFLCVYWLWHFAPWIARKTTRSHDSALSTTHLTLLDLYSFAFLLVGLYFAVDAFGPTLTWLHYAVTHGASEASLTPDQKGNFYTLFKYLVKVIVGLGLAVNGRKLGARLIKRYPPAA